MRMSGYHKWLAGAAGLLSLVNAHAAVVTTSDSSVKLSPEIPTSTQWLYVQVQKANASLSGVAIKWQSGMSLTPIYLDQGPGDYRIRFFATDATTGNGAELTQFSATTVRNTDTRDLAFLLPSIAIQSDSPEILELALSITSGKTSDRERALAVHNWITENLSYDSADLKTMTQPQDALSVLHSKLAVCSGYSNLNAALLRAAGIRTKIILGKLGKADDHEVTCNSTEKENLGHAWNEALIEGHWITIDSTVDSGGLRATDMSFVRTADRQTYFDPTQEVFSAKHLKCDEVALGAN